MLLRWDYFLYLILIVVLLWHKLNIKNKFRLLLDSILLILTCRELRWFKNDSFFLTIYNLGINNKQKCSTSIKLEGVVNFWKRYDPHWVSKIYHWNLQIVFYYKYFIFVYSVLFHWKYLNYRTLVQYPYLMGFNYCSFLVRFSHQKNNIEQILLTIIKCLRINILKED